MRRFRFLLPLLILLVPSGASAWSTQGGRTLDPGHYALEVAAGFPSARLAVHVPLQRHLEVGPFVAFSYFGDVTNPGVRLGNALGARIKLNVLDRGPLQMSLLAQPALVLAYSPAFRIGIQVSLPEWVLGYDILHNLQAFCGLRFPLAFLYDTDYRVRIQVPLLAQVGIEWGVTSRINLFATFEAGPSWSFGAEVPKCEPSAADATRLVCDTRDTTGGNRLDARVDALVGITFAL